MKVLVIAPYITLKGHDEFMLNQTGFGYMVYDIARAVARTEVVDLLATDSRGRSFDSDNVHFLKRSFGSIIFNILKCLPLNFIRQLLKMYPDMKKGTKLRLFYYWLLSGYLKNIIQNGAYDIVHIHGCSFSTELWMQVCKECKLKFVVTLHGLNSFRDTVKLEPAGKKYERDFLMRVIGGEIPITVISSGIKRQIEKVFGAEDIETVKVVCNSFNIAPDKTNISIREKYNIPNDAKVILYVGNISENKNQRQMVDAYGILPDQLKNNTWVLFCGKPSEDGSFENYVKKQTFGEHLVLCGAVEKTEIAGYYREADGVVLLSHTEGFGLSLIEGMHYGVPCAMFSDMDAFDDIYNPTYVVQIPNRNNEMVARALQTLLEKNWDMDAIKKYSEKFSSETMAMNYIKIYKGV